MSAEKMLSQEEVDRMLKALSEHFRCRVAPVDAYCTALETWARTVTKDEKPAVGSLRHAIGAVRFALSKSALAARLVYGGERLRTRECPEHKGRWSGVEFPEKRCPHGCQYTGWLPEPDDTRTPPRAAGDGR